VAHNGGPRPTKYHVIFDPLGNDTNADESDEDELNEDENADEFDGDENVHRRVCIVRGYL
jgi:hypothetical protein